MENEFNDDDFELFLKQKVDHYKMYPSEKVWRNLHGVLHVRRRWFTIGGSLLILAGIFFVAQEFVFSDSSHASLENKAIVPVNPPITYIQTPASYKNNKISSGAQALTLKGSSVKNYNSQTVHAKIPDIVDNGQRAITVFNQVANEEQNTDTKSAATKINTNIIDLAGIKLSTPDPNTVNDNTGSLSSTNVSSSIESGAVIDEDAAPQKEINWLQEIAVIKLTARKKSNFNLQFYFSPTISYRKLSDNNNNPNPYQQNIPLAASHQNVDRYVDHKPSIGAEFGSNVLFAVGKNLTLKTGLQLNYSRYNIQAYKFYSEKASIALNSLGPIADTLTAITSFRNFSGYYPEELQNQYLQVSLPVGAELKLLGNKRLQFTIAGTLQPTYLLFNNTYLLSSDYVNYAKEASLVRKWNLHTSVEAYVSYETAGLRWQAGPQFRYQLMSSYKNLYSIREYLMEYGVKFGVSKTLR